MRFSEFYRRAEPVISFEIFPPKTEEGLTLLESRIPKLIGLRPDFITVTYGAMGSTQERTIEIAALLKNRYRIETAHHLTCVGADQNAVDRILDEIERHGIENIVALRGDPPKGESRFAAPEGGFCHAVDLVSHIRRRRNFSIAVAGYPETHIEAPDFETDLQRLKEKVDAGADLVITQLFYDNRRFYHFLDRCRSIGIEVPIVPGLLPIINLQQIRRITDLCGARIPEGLLEEMENCAVPEDVAGIGIRHTAEQARDLLDHGVEGLHFYVLNRYFHIAEIMNRLRPARA
ncbi:MAG TPA: methylenetetrahydrofolate reductase [NAD(P)H] [Acidobacteriota bacterium]|nr:methylenetetrahydrofolate reductase [NAD(P)H] [Acidobacteriota bacterium]